MEYYKGDIDKAWIRRRDLLEARFDDALLEASRKGTEEKKKKLKFFVRVANFQDTLIISINCY